MRRHASLDELADLGVGVLRPGKAARLTEHVAGCPQCTQLNSQLSDVPPLLASTPYPDIPLDLSTRIDTALASEANLRQASAPATEAGRRDLPARSGHGSAGRGGGGQRFPRLPRRAVSIATAAAAVILVGAGAYAVTTQLGGSPVTHSSSAAGLAGPAASESVGPRVTYGPASSAGSIQTVTSDTDFMPGTLSSQAAAAVKEARQEGVHPMGTRQATAAPDIHSNANIGMSGNGTASGAVQSCVNAIAAGREVLLVELAKYSGNPATLIVTAALGSKPAEAWIVGPLCSAADHDLLAHARLGSS